MFRFSLLGAREAFTCAGHIVALGSHVVVIQTHIFGIGGFGFGARVRTVILEIEGNRFREILFNLFHFSFLLLSGNFLLIIEDDRDLDDHIHGLTALGARDHFREGLHHAESLVVKFLITRTLNNLNIRQSAVGENLGLNGGRTGNFLVFEVDGILFSFVDVAAHGLVTTLERGEGHRRSGHNMLSSGVTFNDGNARFALALTIDIALVALRITHCETSH